MMKRFRHILIAVVALLIVIAPSVTALAESSVSVSVPYYQIWETDVKDADDTFVYKISPVEEDAPLPEGSQEDAYYWTVKGNDKGTLELSIPFIRPGEYSYKVEAYVPKPVKGYVYEHRVYTIDMAIANASDGGFVVDQMAIIESDGNKYDQIDLDPSYTEGKKETETKAETEKPAAPAKGSSAVKTGDTTPVLMLTAVMGISFFVLILLLFIKRRKKEEE